MPPDLNSVPPSPRNPSITATHGATATQTPGPTMSTTQPSHSNHSSHPPSRRASQIYPMSPPPLPLASPGGTLPQTHVAPNQPFPPLSPGVANTGHGGVMVDSQGAPMRHPRPLTAAELHLELEKEQEAVVNRLTRELSALRAHSASVASTASSTSNAPNSSLLFSETALDPTTYHTGALTGPTHPVPTSSRRHRSSSSVSRGSVGAGGAGSYIGGVASERERGIPLNPATASIPHHHRYSLSSQPDISTSVGATNPNFQAARSPSGIPLTREQNHSQQSNTSYPSQPPSATSSRYEETAHHRLELEEVKRENERLRRKIRELERELRGRRNSSLSEVRGRSIGGGARESRESVGGGATNAGAAVSTPGTSQAAE